MIKSLIGALMVSVLNAPQPRINAQHYGLDQVTTNTTQYTAVGDETNYYDYANYNKTNFIAQNNDVDITACVYTQSTCFDNGNNTYDYTVCATSGIFYTNYVKQTPKALWYFKINNKKELQNSKIYLYWYNTYLLNFLDSQTGQIKIETYYTTDTNFDKYYMQVNNTNLDYIDNVKTEIESNLYVNKIEDKYSTNMHEYTLDENNVLSLNYGIYYIMLFMTITTTNTNYGSWRASSNDVIPIYDFRGQYIETTPTATPSTTTNYEVIDIPTLMFTILTMPFSFVSQAFNLTLFAGTPYMINLSQLFLALIGVLVFMFIIKIFLSR